MQILSWNTCLTTKHIPLFEHLMFLNQSLGGIDFFCLSEATPLLSEIFKENGWKTFYVPNTNLRGLLIASKHPLRNQRSYLLSAAKRDNASNESYVAMIETIWRGQRTTIVNTHLTYCRIKELKRRRQERKKLTQILPRNYTVMVGDFNTVLIPYVKWDLKQLGYVSCVKGKTWRWHLKNTWYRMPLKLQLDYIFTTKDMVNSVSAKILKQQKFSDHFPLLIKLH